MDRSSPFSFACKACGTCCRDKRITLFPYEIARLAAALDCSTGKVLECCTEEHGTILRMRESDGFCIFLEKGRCSIHAHRPLACRLWPLGRTIAGGAESFISTQAGPDCRGAFGTSSTVAAFLDSQDAGPYIAASEAYIGLLQRMTARLRNCDGAVNALAGAIAGIGSPDFGWIDVDAVVISYCNEKGIEPPTDVGEKCRLHIAAIEEWINRL